MKNLVNICLVTDTKKRPRVHELLNMPIIKNRIKEFLTTTIANIEFNHTVIHKKDLYQIHNDEKENKCISSNLRSNSRASIENNDALKKSNDDDRLKIEREKHKAEELAKKQKLIQVEKEKEKIKRDQEKIERAKKEQERIKLREKDLKEKEQIKLKELKNSALKDSQNRPTTPSCNLKNVDVRYSSNHSSNNSSNHV